MAQEKQNKKIKKRLDFLGLNFDSFTRLSFTSEVKSYSKNSMLVYFNFEKFKVALKPDFVSGFPDILRYPKSGNIKLLRWLILPLLCIYHHLLIFFFFSYLCIRYRPKVCWTEHTFLAMIFGFAKKLGLCETAIYVIGDWLVSKQEKNWIKYIGNNILWLVMDYIAASLNSVVIHNSRQIYLARNDYWGRKVIENEVIQFPPPININPNAADEKRFCIGFMGQVLENSGLELILPHLRTLNQKYGIKLKIAGPNTPFRGFIEQEIKRHDLGNIVELNKFVDLDVIHTFLNTCFCGINLIKSEDSHSTYTIPGKIIQYLQVLTPILITKHNGDFVQVTQENNLGLVIKPESQYIVPAIENLFKNQKEFRKNINCYASKQSIETVSEYISSCENQRSHR